MSQLAFDLDAMIEEANPEPPRAPWAGRAPLRFTTAPFTLNEFLAAFAEYVEIHGHSNCLAESHMWHKGYDGRATGTPGHSMQVLNADLRCRHFGSPCSCVSSSLYRAACECGWTSPVTETESFAIEIWHDHSWPGWRALPIVPEDVRPGAGGITSKSKKALEWVTANYPEDWRRDGAPVLTRRSGLGTRHVPGYSPWGGYDIAADNLAPVFTHVRGTVCLTPPMVRCDGCGYTATGDHLAHLILTCGITFNPRIDDERRLCRECRTTEWNQS